METNQFVLTAFDCVSPLFLAGSNSSHEPGCDVTFQREVGRSGAELLDGSQAETRRHNNAHQSQQTAKPHQ